MVEQLAMDYAAYFKLDFANGFQSVQDVIDNMHVRLEELASVLRMIKLKNSDCQSYVCDDISNYRNDINTLSKKIATVNNVILKLQTNVDLLEKQVEKAESNFRVINDSKIKKILKPFLKKTKDTSSFDSAAITLPIKLYLESVSSNFTAS